MHRQKVQLPEGELLQQKTQLPEGKLLIRRLQVINYSNYTLEVTPSTADSFVFVEVLKKKTDTKASALHTYSWSETAK